MFQINVLTKKFFRKLHEKEVKPALNECLENILKYLEKWSNGYY